MRRRSILVLIFLPCFALSAFAGICDLKAWLFGKKPPADPEKAMFARVSGEKPTKGWIRLEGPGSPEIELNFTGQSMYRSADRHYRAAVTGTESEAWEIFKKLVEKYNARFNTRGAPWQPQKSPLNRHGFETGYIEMSQRASDQENTYIIYFHNGRAEPMVAENLLTVLREDFGLRLENP